MVGKGRQDSKLSVSNNVHVFLMSANSIFNLHVAIFLPLINPCVLIVIAIIRSLCISS